MFDKLSHALSLVGKAVSEIFIGASLILSPQVADVSPQPIIPQENLGAYSAAADFRTSLAFEISSSATSMTLASITTPSGESLVSGKTYGFKLGGQEYVKGVLSGSQITGMTRGVSLINGTSTGATAKAWGRGTAVELTDAPLLLEIAGKVNGEGEFDNAIKYASSVSTSTLAANSQNLASVAYANSLSFGAIAQATETVGGFVELSTGAEAAATTLSGSVARLALPTAISTSTAPASGNYIPVTGSSGDIAEGFLPTTLAQSYTFTGTTTFLTSVSATSTIVQTYNASTTWSKPANLKYIEVQAWGAGGSGGAETGAGNETGGGGGGAYFFRRILASDLTSTVTVTIGTGGAAVAPNNNGNVGGNTSFGSYVVAYGGGGGASGGSNAGGGGGGGALSAGNTATNATGATGGGPGGSAAATGNAGFGGGGGGTGAGSTNGGNSAYGGGGGSADGGTGGSSLYGGGGGAGNGVSTAGTSLFGGNGGGTGAAGTAPGGGGGGGNDSNSGAGANGRVIVTEYYF